MSPAGRHAGEPWARFAGFVNNKLTTFLSKAQRIDFPTNALLAEELFDEAHKLDYLNLFNLHFSVTVADASYERDNIDIMTTGVGTTEMGFPERVGMAFWPTHSGDECHIEPDSISFGDSLRHYLPHIGFPCPEGGSLAIVGARFSARSAMTQRIYKNCFIFYIPGPQMLWLEGLPGSVAEAKTALLRSSMGDCAAQHEFLRVPLDLASVAECVFATRRSLGVVVVPIAADVGERGVFDSLGALTAVEGQLVEHGYDATIMVGRMHYGTARLWIAALPLIPDNRAADAPAPM